MPYTKPTLNTIIENAGQAIMTRVFGAARAAPLRSVARGIADAIGAGVYGVYGYIAYLFEQAIPDTAEGTFLTRWAAIYGVTRGAGDPAIGDIDVTGAATDTLPAGSTVQRTDGVQFTTDIDLTLIAGAGTVAVTATTNGTTTNTASGETLTLTAPVTGINSDTTTASGGLTGGADEETDARLEQRMLQRIQNPPQGGKASDYEAWALQANTSVTRATVAGAYPAAGQVTIWPLVDDGAGGVAPAAGVVTDVDAYIDARRPVTAAVSVLTVTEVAVSVSVAILPDTAALRTAVEASIQRMHETRTVVETDDSGTPTGTIPLSWITDAVGETLGIDSHSVTVPAGDTTFNNGEIGTIGTVTFI